MRDATRVVVVAGVVATLATLAFPAYLSLRADQSRVFEPETFDIALVAWTSFLIAVGAQVAPKRAARYLTALALLASGMLVLGVLSTILVVFALAGAIVLLMLYRALRLTPRSQVATRAALGGALVGGALPLLYVALVIPATVECRENGGATSSRRWHPSNSLIMSSGTVDRNGVATGYIDDGNTVATYRCEGAHLASFQRTPK